MKRTTLKLEDARQKNPPVDPVQAQRQSLQLALFDAIKPGDVQLVAQKLKDQALAGDLRAVKLLLGLVLPPAGGHSTQAVQVNVGQRPEDDGPCDYKRPLRVAGVAVEPPRPGLRLDLARHLAAAGPSSTARVAEALRLPAPDVAEALGGDPWFESEVDGWHLTHVAHAEALQKGD